MERLPSPEKKINWAGNGEVEWSLSSRWEEREREREQKKQFVMNGGLSRNTSFVLFGDCD